jgi:hypothetical protein
MFATKEADKDVRTTKVAAERRVALCVVYVVIEIPYDMIQSFCVGIALL